MEQAFRIRRTVFIEEQGVPESIEMDELDASAVHVLCVVGNKAVATGRLNFIDGEAKMGRVAVLQEHRGKGIGSLVVFFLMRQAREMGYHKVYANVQMHTGDFYARHGFKPVGSNFMEAGIQHIRMERMTGG